VDIVLEASDGWISGPFHAELSADAESSPLFGPAFEPAERPRGALGLSVDRRRPHEASANLHIEFSPSGVRGSLGMTVSYSDRGEPFLDAGEQLFWPPVAGEPCSPPWPSGDGSEWLSIDAYRDIPGAR
jgi:hypothetical protein